MLIGLDARLWGTAHGGIGRYIAELIVHLLKIDRNNQYVFFVYNDFDRRAIVENLRERLPRDLKRTFEFVLAPYRWYSLNEQLFMASVIKKARVDLMHFPHFNVPILYNGRYIVSVHDLIIHHFPDERATTLPPWLYQLKLMGYKKVLHHAITGARQIITPSRFTKEDLLNYYKIDSKKVSVIYEGVNQLNQKIRNKKLEIKNYLLYVGSAYPHNNLEKLIEALKILRTKNNQTNLDLVIAGKIDFFANRLQKQIGVNFPELLPHIKFFGVADDDELALLYQNAALYVFPSLYEGFGLPPLEAMSFGLPVVAAEATSIPEICEDAAIYFDPNDATDMADKINQVLIDQKLQADLREKGLALIKKYSWEQMAQETLEVYQTKRK